MTVKIGPTFLSELAAAGCLAAVAGYAEDGTITFAPNATSDQVAAVQAVLAKHDPTRPAPREAKPKQVRYALNLLAVRASWNAAVAKAAQSNPEAQDYWDTADPIREDNAKILKWCTAAGITPRQLFDLAVTQ